MTDQDWIDLGRRAVAWRGWRWMPGMLSGKNDRVVYTDPDCAGALVSSGCPSGPDWEENLDPPDFRDPATLGCLLALVREVLGELLASVEVRQPGDIGCRACVRVPVGSEGWRTIQWWRASQDPQYSEAHALVAALESAPEVTR